jgi:N-formylglutamate deformylase
MSFVILHIPHESRRIPTDVRSTLLPNSKRLQRELLLMTDAWTGKLVEPLAIAAERIVFPVSRLVVDPERFLDDTVEPMARKGMGAVYTRLSSGEPLRTLTAHQRNALLNRFYRPHHQRLIEAVERALRECGRCLIVDVHSFSSTPLPHEPDQSERNSDICIGFETYHSPFGSKSEIESLGRRHAFRASINAPFAGSIVPAKFWLRDARVRSFMLEVRRDIYMNEQTGLMRHDFIGVSGKISGLIAEVATQFAEENRLEPWKAE